MRTLYSSQTMAGDPRLSWQTLIRALYADLDIEIASRQNFSGRISRAGIGAIELTEVQTDGEQARRTARHIAKDSREYFLYLLVRRGQINVTQFGRDCTIGPGEFTLMDLNSPYVFRHDGFVDKLGLKIPAPLLKPATRDLVAHCAIGKRASEGVARLAAGYAASLYRESDALSDAAAHGVSRTVADLLGLLFSTESVSLPDETAVRTAMRTRCMAYIDAHYPNPALDPESIAAAMRISVRYLHQCFAAADRTVMQYLRTKRLECAHADLVAAGQRSLSISEIAWRNGFRNVSHFSDAFKSHFGISPRQAHLPHALTAENGASKRAGRNGNHTAASLHKA